MKVWLTVVVFAWMLCMNGCTKEGSADRFFAYRQAEFTAEIEGNRQGKAVSCEAEYANGRLQSVTYTAPEALCGMTLEREGEEWIARFKGKDYRFGEGSTAAGLLFPARLLLLEGAEVRELQKLQTGVLLTLSCPLVDDPVTLTLNSKGEPTVLSCGEWSLRVAFQAHE